MEKSWRGFSACLALLFLFLCPLGGRAAGEVGPGNRYYLVRDLSDDWLTYSEEYGNYVPYTGGADESAPSVSLLLDLRSNQHYYLLVSTARENYLFLEGSLQQKLAPGAWVTLGIDSLRRVYGKNTILVTLYGSPGAGDKTALIGHAREGSALGTGGPAVSPLSVVNIKPIGSGPFMDFSILVALLLLLLSLFAYTSSPSTFLRFVRPVDYLDRAKRDDLYAYFKPYSRFMFVMAVFVCVAMAYLLLFLHHHGVNVPNPSGLFGEGGTLGGLFADLGVLVAGCLGLLLAKYLLMRLVGSVLNLSAVVNTHYTKALQLSYLFYGVCTLASFSLLASYPGLLQPLRPYLLYGVVAYYLVRVVLLYLFANYPVRVINLYLFSYLCVVEIIPLIIGVKFAV